MNVALVVANKTGIPALEKAERLGVPTRVLPKADLNREDVVLPLMKEYSIDFIVLAGFLLVIPDFLIHEYDHRMINLHPALLPKFGGMGMYGHHVHEAVKAAGETETGMTVHWVSGKVDSGGIIAQFRTPISPDDTPDDIAAKEPKEKRHPSMLFSTAQGQPQTSTIKGSARWLSTDCGAVKPFAPPKK